MVIFPLHLFKALADETRLRIVNILRYHDFNVNELVTILEMGQSRISRHLKILTDSEILNFQREGLWIFYYPNRSGSGADFLEAVKDLLNKEPHFSSDREKAKSLLENTKDQTLSFFNTLAQEWNSLKQNIFSGFDMESVLLDNIEHCESAADLGCGTGDFLSSLLARADKVIGVDASKSMLGKAQKTIENSGSPERIELRLGEIEHLPLRDNEVDCALINMVLHHLPSPITGIQEAQRVLKNGKSIVVTDFLKHNDESLRTRFGDRRLGFTPEDIEKMLSESGFTLEKHRTYPLQNGLSILLYSAKKTSQGVYV